jgi:hypothetical protein
VAIDERSRHELHQRLEQVLGADEAGTLMEHLPPVGWADVATKRDLDAMEKYLLGTFRSEIAQAISSQTRTLVLTNIGAVLGAIAVVIAAARL